MTWAALVGKKAADGPRRSGGAQVLPEQRKPPQPNNPKHVVPSSVLASGQSMAPAPPIVPVIPVVKKNLTSSPAGNSVSTTPCTPNKLPSSDEQKSPVKEPTLPSQTLSESTHEMNHLTKTPIDSKFVKENNGGSMEEALVNAPLPVQKLAVPVASKETVSHGETPKATEVQKPVKPSVPIVRKNGMEQKGSLPKTWVIQPNNANNINPSQPSQQPQRNVYPTAFYIPQMPFIYRPTGHGDPSRIQHYGPINPPPPCFAQEPPGQATPYSPFAYNYTFAPTSGYIPQRQTGVYQPADYAYPSPYNQQKVPAHHVHVGVPQRIPQPIPVGPPHPHSNMAYTPMPPQGFMFPQHTVPETLRNNPKIHEILQAYAGGTIPGIPQPRPVQHQFINNNPQKQEMKTRPANSMSQKSGKSTSVAVPVVKQQAEDQRTPMKAPDFPPVEKIVEIPEVESHQTETQPVPKILPTKTKPTVMANNRRWEVGPKPNPIPQEKKVLEVEANVNNNIVVAPIPPPVACEHKIAHTIQAPLPAEEVVEVPLTYPELEMMPAPISVCTPPRNAVRDEDLKEDLPVVEHNAARPLELQNSWVNGAPKTLRAKFVPTTETAPSVAVSSNSNSSWKPVDVGQIQKPVVEKAQDWGQLPDPTRAPAVHRPVVVKKKPKNWAALLKSSSQNKNPGATPFKSPNHPSPDKKLNVSTSRLLNSTQSNSESSAAKEKKMLYNTEKEATFCGKRNIALLNSESCVKLQPIGFNNTQNFCYLNAVLQAVFSVPWFAQLFKKTINGDQAKRFGPVCESIYTLLKTVPEDTPAVPSLNPRNPARFITNIRFLDAVLKSFPRNAMNQNDAHEFFVWLLNQLHDELKFEPTKKVKAEEDKSAKKADETEEENEWQIAGTKGRGHIISNDLKFENSPIQQIFGGRLRSILKTKNQTPSVTHEPFMSLSLDTYQKIETLDQALVAFLSKDTITGLRTSKNQKYGQRASKTHKIDTLPPVLVLHCKLFTYDKKTETLRKKVKKLKFSVELTIKHRLLYNAVPNSPSPRYLLRAIINHHGKAVDSGHYSATVYTGEKNHWLRIDDKNIRSIKEERALDPPGASPYVLIYERYNGQASQTPQQ